MMGIAIQSIIGNGRKLEKLRITKDKLPLQSDMNEINRKIEEAMKDYDLYIALKDQLNMVSGFGNANRHLLGAKEFLELLDGE